MWPYTDGHPVNQGSGYFNRGVAEAHVLVTKLTLGHGRESFHAAVEISTGSHRN